MTVPSEADEAYTANGAAHSLNPDAESIERVWETRRERRETWERLRVIRGRVRVHGAETTGRKAEGSQLATQEDRLLSIAVEAWIRA